MRIAIVALLVPLELAVATLGQDFDAALAYLKAQGVKVLGEPTRRATGPSAGQTWIYFLSPWGMQFELVSFPNGKGYEAGAPVRLWHPGHPAD